jgi:hypothetical protein
MRARKPVKRKPRRKAVELTNDLIYDTLDKAGFKIVPKHEHTDLDDLKNRVDVLISSASDAFAAGKQATTAVKVLGDAVIPLLNDIRAELGQHRGRITLLERGQADHATRIEQLELHVLPKKGETP